MASQHWLNWPLEEGGGMFTAHLSGRWTKRDVELLRKALDHLMEVADIGAMPGLPPPDLQNADET